MRARMPLVAGEPAGPLGVRAGSQDKTLPGFPGARRLQIGRPSDGGCAGAPRRGLPCRGAAGAAGVCDADRWRDAQVGRRACREGGRGGPRPARLDSATGRVPRRSLASAHNYFAPSIVRRFREVEVCSRGLDKFFAAVCGPVALAGELPVPHAPPHAPHGGRAHA
jgi:hypothetical protein